MKRLRHVIGIFTPNIVDFELRNYHSTFLRGALSVPLQKDYRTIGLNFLNRGQKFVKHIFSLKQISGGGSYWPQEAGRLGRIHV